MSTSLPQPKESLALEFHTTWNEIECGRSDTSACHSHRRNTNWQGPKPRQSCAFLILPPPPPLFFPSAPGTQLWTWLPSELLRLLRQCLQLWAQVGVKALRAPRFDAFGRFGIQGAEGIRTVLQSAFRVLTVTVETLTEAKLVQLYGFVGLGLTGLGRRSRQPQGVAKGTCFLRLHVAVAVVVQ